MFSQLLSAPCWYDVVAALLTLYQGYRGYVLQWRFGPAQGSLTKTAERVLVLRVADAILYLLSSAAGFAALWVGYTLSLSTAAKLNEITAGAAALLIFLWLFGVLGVTGQLPYLIQQGKILPLPPSSK